MENLLGLKKLCGMFMSFVCMMLVCSCSSDEYRNAIPSTATALVRINTSRIDGSEAMRTLSSLLSTDNLAESGIDLKSDIFAFETVDGNFGMCAKVGDQDKLAEFMNSLSSKGKCGTVRKQNGCFFSDINNVWAVGFSNKALLVLGPVSAAAIADAQAGLAKMLRQKEESSIVGTPMYAKLDSMESAVSMVAQVQALPEKMMAPFIIGAPKDADASQVLVAVDFSKSGGTIRMSGETFSFDKSINAALAKAHMVYRKINSDYIALVPQNCSVGLFTNVDGKQFLPLLHDNKSMQALLVGINTAIDFDNITRSVDGNLFLVSSGMLSSKLNLTMLARTDKPLWTGDVDYWKQSCPAGSRITGAGQSWRYSGKDANFAFGLVGNMFYLTTDDSMNPTIPGQKHAAIGNDIQGLIKGNRMVMLLNLQSLTSGGGLLPQGVGNFMKAMLGNAEYIVYTMK